MGYFDDLYAGLEEGRPERPAASEPRQLRTGYFDDLYAGLDGPGDLAGSAPPEPPEDPGIFDTYVKPVLDSPPVRATIGVLSGFSDIAGAAAEEAKAALSGVQSRVGLTEEGRRRYAEEVGASSEPVNPLTIDLGRYGYETPGVEQVAKEGIAQGIHLGAEAVGLTSDLSRPDLTRAGGVEGPRGITAAIAEGVGEFALGLGTDPVSAAYLRAGNKMVRAQKALQAAERVAEVAPDLAPDAIREARKLYLQAQAEEWAAKQVDLGTGVASIPAIAGQAVDQGRAAYEEYRRNGLTPAAAEAATQAVLGVIGAGMVGGDALDVRRALADPRRGQLPEPLQEALAALEEKARINGPDFLTLTPEEQAALDALNESPLGEDPARTVPGELEAPPEFDAALLGQAPPVRPARVEAPPPAIDIDTQGLVLEEDAQRQADADEALLDRLIAERLARQQVALNTPPPRPLPGVPDVWTGEEPPGAPAGVDERSAMLQAASERDLLDRVEADRAARQEAADEGMLERLLKEREARQAAARRVAEIRSQNALADLEQGAPASGAEPDLGSLVVDEARQAREDRAMLERLRAERQRRMPEVPPGFGEMGADGRFSVEAANAEERISKVAPDVTDDEIEVVLKAAQDALSRPMSKGERRDLLQRVFAGELPSATKKHVFGLGRLTEDPGQIARAIEKDGDNPLYLKAKEEIARELQFGKEQAADSGAVAPEDPGDVSFDVDTLERGLDEDVARLRPPAGFAAMGAEGGFPEGFVRQRLEAPPQLPPGFGSMGAEARFPEEFTRQRLSAVPKVPPGFGELGAEGRFPGFPEERSPEPEAPEPTPPATTIEKTEAGDQRTLVEALDTTTPQRPREGFHDSPLFNPERAAEDKRLQDAQGNLFGDLVPEEKPEAPAEAPAPSGPEHGDTSTEGGWTQRWDGFQQVWTAPYRILDSVSTGEGTELRLLESRVSKNPFSVQSFDTEAKRAYPEVRKYQTLEEAKKGFREAQGLPEPEAKAPPREPAKRPEFSFLRRIEDFGFKVRTNDAVRTENGITTRVYQLGDNAFQWDAKADDGRVIVSDEQKSRFAGFPLPEEAAASADRAIAEYLDEQAKIKRVQNPEPAAAEEKPDTVHVRFTKKPSEAVRTDLKQRGFRWDKDAAQWTKRNPSAGDLESVGKSGGSVVKMKGGKLIGKPPAVSGDVEGAPRGPKTAQERFAGQALIQLSNMDPDHARERNGEGFSQFDGQFGHSLARQYQSSGALSDKQWARAVDLARKYRRQVGEMPEAEVPPAETKAGGDDVLRGDGAADQPAVEPESGDAGSLAGVPAPDEQGAAGEGNVRQGGGRRSRADAERPQPARGEGDGLVQRVGGDQERVVPPAAGAASPEKEEAGAGSSVVPPAVEKATRKETKEDTRQEDYRITPEDKVGQSSIKQKGVDNIRALEILRDLAKEGRLPTEEERRALVRYSGWGALAQQMLDEPHRYKDYYGGPGKHPEFAELRAKLADLMTEEERAGALHSALNAHYTDPAVISPIWGALRRLGVTGKMRFLEPAVGVGHFYGMMPADLAQGSVRTGIDLDPITAKIAALLYPRSDIRPPMGFEEAPLPEGFYDVVVSNVPFGSYGVVDRVFNKYPFLKKSIHNYYFAKALRHTRPGGVVAFVTSRYSMDGKTPLARMFREWVAKQADLLGAVRLPAGTFAKNAGTQVTTDVIFLRKRAEGEAPAGESWAKATEVHVKHESEVKYREGAAPQEGEEFAINEYYQRHPELVLGEHVVGRGMRNDRELKVLGEFSAEKMVAALEKALPEGVVKPRAIPTSATSKAEVIPLLVEDPKAVKNFGYAIREGGIVQRIGGELVRKDWTGKTAARVTGMIGVRDALAKVLKSQIDGTSEEDVAKARQELNRAYDEFVREHGVLSDDTNRNLFRLDPDAPRLLALEDAYEPAITRKAAKKAGVESRAGTAKKAAIFSKRTLDLTKRATSADSPADALAITVAEDGVIDWARIADLTGVSEKAAQEALEGTAVFRDPEGGSWETADSYLSGNVRRKLKIAEAAARVDPAFKAHVEALKKVQPDEIPQDRVTARLGATFIDPADYAAFANEQTGATNFKVFLDESTGTWYLRGSDYSPGVAGVKVSTLIENALNQKGPPRVTMPDGNGGRVQDPEANAIVEDAFEKIQDAFERWIWKDKARAERTIEAFRDKFAGVVQRHFDGRFLTLPGMSRTELRNGTLGPHQVNAVMRILHGGNTLLAHEVGLGKTYTMIAGAMELRRLGVAKKPMIVVPPHILSQWGKAFTSLYPGARVLVATKADLEKQNRKLFMSRIATGDWDAVVVSREGFGRLPVATETERAYVQEQLDEVEEVIRAAEAEGEDKKTVKKIQAVRTALEVRLKTLLSAPKDDTVTFDELGVDYLFVDEAHEYKSLPFYTKMTRVAGLQQRRSQRAQDMHMKTRIVSRLHGGSSGVVFATGTPIANTMAEMYTMQRFLDEQGLRDAGVRSFDSWAAQFGTAVRSTEQGVDLQWRQVARFKKFVNLPALSTMFRKFADVRHASDEGVDIIRPTMEGGETPDQPIVESAEEPPQMGAFVADLVKRLKMVRSRMVDATEDNPLKISSDARKAALDFRLVDPSAPDFAGSKLNKSVENMFRIWSETKEKRLTQAVFADLGVPNAGKREAEEAAAEKVEQLASDSEEAETDTDVVADVPEESLKFNVYADIKRKLMARGVPESEIAFAHDAKNPAQQLELYRKVNAGEVRIIIGSTGKMSTGANIQERLYALHHLDAPWRPADVEQREGRILRQGNTNEKVRVYRYVTEGSFDAFMWGTLKNKAGFITQVMRGDPNVYEAEDVGDVTLSYAEAEAFASGNPDVVKKLDLEAEIQKLLRQKSGYDRQRNEDTQRLSLDLPAKIASAQHEIASLEEIKGKAKPPATGDEFRMKVGGEEFSKRDDAIKAATAAAEKAEPGSVVGEYRGLEIVVHEIVEEGKRSGERDLDQYNEFMAKRRSEGIAENRADDWEAWSKYEKQNRGGGVVTEAQAKKIAADALAEELAKNPKLTNEQKRKIFDAAHDAAVGGSRPEVTKRRVFLVRLPGSETPMTSPDRAVSINSDITASIDANLRNVQTKIATAQEELARYEQQVEALEKRRAQPWEKQDRLDEAQVDLAVINARLRAAEAAATAGKETPDNEPSNYKDFRSVMDWIGAQGMLGDVGALGVVEGTDEVIWKHISKSLNSGVKPEEVLAHPEVPKVIKDRIRKKLDAFVDDLLGVDRSQIILDAMDTIKPMAKGGTGQAPSVGVPELWEATKGQFANREAFDAALLQLQRDGRIGTERGDTGLSPERFAASTPDPSRPGGARIMSVYRRGDPDLKGVAGSDTEATKRRVKVAESREKVALGDITIASPDAEHDAISESLGQTLGTDAAKAIHRAAKSIAAQVKRVVGGEAKFLGLTVDGGVHGYSLQEGIRVNVLAEWERAVHRAGQKKTTGGQNVEREAARGITNVLIHEIAHATVKGHGRQHTAEMVRLMRALSGEPLFRLRASIEAALRGKKLGPVLEQALGVWDGSVRGGRDRGADRGVSAEAGDRPGEGAQRRPGGEGGRPGLAEALPAGGGREAGDVGAGTGRGAGEPGVRLIREGEPHKLGSTQIELPDDVASMVKTAINRVAEADLAGDGREDRPHITVKYGLHTEDAGDVARLLRDEGSIHVRLGKVSSFPPSESGDGAAVLKVDVDSPDLHKLNAKIASGTEVTDTHPEYKPHVTLAYVNPEAVKKYVGDDSLEGQEATVDRVTFSAKDGREYEVDLMERRAPGIPEPAPGVPLPGTPAKQEAKPAPGQPGFERKIKPIPPTTKPATEGMLPFEFGTMVDYSPKGGGQKRSGVVVTPGKKSTEVKLEGVPGLVQVPTAALVAVGRIQDATMRRKARPVTPAESTSELGKAFADRGPVDITGKPGDGTAPFNLNHTGMSEQNQELAARTWKAGGDRLEQAAQRMTQGEIKQQAEDFLRDCGAAADFEKALKAGVPLGDAKAVLTMRLIQRDYVERLAQARDRLREAVRSGQGKAEAEKDLLLLAFQKANFDSAARGAQAQAARALFAFKIALEETGPVRDLLRKSFRWSC